MKNIFLLFCCILLFNCNRKNENTQRKILKYHDFSNIKLNNNSVIFEFIYNDENYKIMFHGKDIIAFHIAKNFEVNKNIPPLTLDFEKNEGQFIIDELNKSPVFNQMNEKSMNDINLINISYKMDLFQDSVSFGKDFSAESEVEFPEAEALEIPLYNINEVQNINVSIVPTDELVNFLIKLIDIYYMPLYTVQENDTLSSICLKIYGNTNYEQIVKYNPELGMKVLDKYFIVRPGQKIRFKK